MLKQKIIKNLLLVILLTLMHVNAKQINVLINTKFKETVSCIKKSDLFTYKKSSFNNEYDLIVNIQKDLELLEKFLKFYGFFDAKIKYNSKTKNDNYTIEFDINEGKRYIINNITYNQPIDCNTSKFLGKPFKITYTENIQNQIIDSLFGQGFSNAKIDSVQLKHNKINKTVDLHIVFEKGIKQQFGETKISGLYNIRYSKIAKFITWKKNDPFLPSKLDDFRNNISKLNFFSDINIFTIEHDNTQNVYVNLVEDKKYSIECGLKFTTARNINYKNSGIKKLKGLIINAKWTNNIFGKKCDKLILSAEGMPFYEKNKIINSMNRNIAPDYNFKAELIKNELFKETYSHRIYGEFSQTWSNKYIKKGFLIGYYLSQFKRSKYNNSYKLFYENYKLKTFSHNKHKKVYKETFGYLNFQYIFDVDKRDNFSEPSQGLHAVYTISPEICINKPSHLLALDVFHSFFIPIYNEKNISVTWIRFKSILSSTKEIPANKMVYSGGGKSIRGYYVDFAGEVKNDIPEGGKSSLEIGIEFRKRFSKNWGGCVFIEGSRVHSNIFPSHGKFYNAYGLGVRYYSSFGPIRIDMGFPFKKRPGTDAFAQIYVSLGHRF